jgi:PKD repeat protein/subtilisin family serine protease
MRWQPVLKVVTSLSAKTETLRVILIALLAMMLVLPASMAVVDSLVGTDEGPSYNDPSATDSGSSPPSRSFWASGGTHDVIVWFKDPCVVQYRTVQEDSGVSSPDTLATLSREYKARLMVDHEIFMTAIREAFPEVIQNQEFTTVLNGLALTASSQALDTISQHPDVAIIEPDTIVEIDLANSVPLINADDLWTARNASGDLLKGNGTVVSILDTGIDYSHPDLGGTGVRATDLASVGAGTHPRIIGGYDIINDDSDFWDGHFHGTHCAGIVGANGTVVGVAPETSFLIYKVLSDGGSGPSSGIIEGVELSTDPDDDGDTSDHADVISMSLSGPGHPDDSKSAAVDNAVAAGAVVAVAASNEGPRYETLKSPSEARRAISVGATSKADVLASFSSVGPSATYEIKPDLTGPGVSIYSTSRNNLWRTAGGTSMATPHVAGAAALLIQSHPGWSADQVKQALMGTSKDLGYNAYRQGAGRIDVLAANDTPVVADPPSVSLGRLKASSNTTTFTINFTNLAAGWTNGTLTWMLKYELTNLYSASNDNTDYKAMIGANTTSVDIAKDGSFIVKFTVTYDHTAKIGHHLGEVKLTTGSGTIRVPVGFYIVAPILIVDDDNTDWSTNPPFNNHNPYTYYSYPFYKRLDSSKLIADALVALNEPFDVFTVRWYFNGPSKDLMSQYRLVIWNCGFDYNSYGRSLSSTDLASLKGYAEGGGNIWLLGSLIFFDLYGGNNKTLPSTDSLRATFGVGEYQRYSGTPDPLPGVTGTLTGGVSYDIETTTWGNVDYGNNMTPADGAYMVFSGNATDYWGASWTNVANGIARESGTNKTLFTAFSFGQISSVNDRKDLVDRVVQWVDVRPHGSISLTGDLKEGESITFDGSVLDPRVLESYTFQWDFTYDGATFSQDDTGAQVSHSYDDNGNYTVALRLREARADRFSALVFSPVDVINQAPEAHLDSSSPGNEGSPVNFWGNATDPGGNDTFTWEWDFEYDGITFQSDLTTQNGSYTYLDDGTYTAALRVTDDDGMTSAINTTTVVVNNLPPSGNMFTPGLSNEGEEVPFTATVSDPSPLDTVIVEWDFEYNGRTFSAMANGTAVNHTYLDDGTFTVMMRLTDDDGGVANFTLQVVVRNVAPTIDFTNTAPVDEGGVVDFNSTVTDPGENDIHTFDWDFEYDGLSFTPTGTRQNVSYQYTQDGNYTVALRVRDDDGGESFITHEIQVLNVAPVPSIGKVSGVDEGEKVRFFGNQTDEGIRDTFTYLWDFGDDGSSTLKNPVHTYMDDGLYTVNFTVTDDAGAFGVTSVQVTVNNVAPNATVAITPTHIKENGTVYFQAEGHAPSPPDELALSYTWNFGDGESSNLQEVAHTYMDDGCFTVSLTVQDDDDGVTTYTYHVLVDNVAPSVFAQADREYITEGGTVNFTAAIEDPGPLDTHTASWDFDDGGTSDLLEVQHTFADDGNYIVVLTVTDNSGGTNTTTFRVSVSNVRPTLVAEANTTDINEGDQVSFTASWTDPGLLDEHTIRWEFGDGVNMSDITDPTHRFDQDGTYTVLVTVTDDDGGQASKPFIIKVSNVPPTPIITVNNVQIDETGTVSFSASSTDPGPEDVVTYFWDLGDDFKTSDVSFNHVYQDNGVYRVTLRADDGDGGISPPATVTITVNNVPPTLTATADLTETTIGKGVTFAATANDISPEDTVNFTWSFGDFTTSDQAQVTHVFTTTGTFEVVLIATDDDGGQSVWETSIVVKPDLDGDGIADSDDKDIDGDGYDNSDDDFPRDAAKYKDWNSTYLMLLIIVVVAVAVVAYIMRPKG